MRPEHWFQTLRLRLRSLFRRPQADQELAEELEYHVQQTIQEYVAKGLSATEAHHAALRDFGGVAQIIEGCRDMRKVNWIHNLIQDVRYGLRMLRKAPGFTVVSVLTLALGIGANTAIFSVVNSVLLKPLPYPDPERLVLVSLRVKTGGSQNLTMGTDDFLALNSRQSTFDGVAALKMTDNGFTLTGSGAPEQYAGSAVTADFFAILGVRPLLGRTFLRGEDQPGHKRSVVISHRFWREHLHADPDAVGKELTLDSNSYTVIGVMPPDFHFGPQDNDELWPILQLRPLNRRPPYFLLTIGRLRAGVSEAQAAADASGIARQVQQQYPDSPFSSAGIQPMKKLLVGNVQLALLVLLGAVGLVLFIAVVNVANLQVARAAGRAKEMAVRSALGASRGRLIAQLLTENILLALVGGALGLFVSQWPLSMIRGLAGDIVPRLGEVTIDTRVLAFTAAIALLSGVVFGLFPALRAHVSSVNEFLKEGGRTGQGPRNRRLRDALVVAEFSLALVLLVGSGLLLRSLLTLESVSPGFSPEHIVTMQFSLPAQRYADSAKVTSFYQELLQKVENMPGVKSAAIASSLPPNLLEISNPSICPADLRFRARHPMWRRRFRSAQVTFRRWVMCRSSADALSLMPTGLRPAVF
jgi:predicted permease